MKVDVSTELKSLAGDVLMDADSKEKESVTVKKIIVNALFMPVKEDTGMDKAKKYELATRIFKADSVVDLAVDEVSLIKNLVADAFPSALIVGQVWEILDKG